MTCKLSELKAGDIIRVPEGHCDCLSAGTYTVHNDEEHGLYINCEFGTGRHFLIGEVDHGDRDILPFTKED